MDERRGFRLRLIGVIFRVDIDKRITEVCERLGVPDLASIAESRITFDLTATTFLHLDCASWLLILMDQLRRNGNEVKLVLPEVERRPEGHRLTTSSEYLWSFMIRWNFFKILEKRNQLADLLTHSQLVLASQPSGYSQATMFDEHDHQIPLASNRLLPISRLPTAADAETNEAAGVLIVDDIDAVVERYSDLIVMGGLVTACDVAREDSAPLVSRFVANAAYNTYDHSRGDLCYASMQIIGPKLSKVALVPPCLVVSIVDNGDGIPAVLRKAGTDGDIRLHRRHKDNDAELIREYTEFATLSDSLMVQRSTDAWVRSHPEREGLGLYEARQAARLMGASMRIRSGKAEVVFLPDGEVTSSDRFTQATGTVVRLEIPLRSSWS